MSEAGRAPRSGSAGPHRCLCVSARGHRRLRVCAAMAMLCLAGGPEARARSPAPPVAAADTIPIEGQPPYLVPTLEAGLGTIVTRIAGNTGAPTTPLAGVWGTDTRHVYSNQQPWNSDQSLLIIENREGGSPTPLILDGNTYEPLFAPCPGAGLFDYRWHPARTHPHELINVSGDGRTLSWFDVTTCTRTRVWTLPVTVNYGIGSGTGNPSQAGRFVALGNEQGMFVVDMDPQPPLPPYPAVRIGPLYAFPPCSLSVTFPTNCAIGMLSISPTGRYVDLKYSGGDDTTTDLHRIYDVDPQTLALSPHVMSGSAMRCGSFATRPNGWVFPLKHADLTTDPSDGGEDVLVGGRACPGASIGRVVKVRLRDGAVTALTDPLNEAPVSHVSTRNTARPGWAYVSYFRAPGKRFSAEIVAVNLDGSHQVERYAHSHGLTPGCYRCEAHPVPSPDGKRVLFASNWALDCGDSCGAASEVRDYVAQFPEVPRPPPGPTSFDLEGAFPNPSPAEPLVAYSLGDQVPARLELVDLLGRVVLRRELGEPGPGRHTAVLDAGHVPQGIYWLRLVQAGRTASARVVLLR